MTDTLEHTARQIAEHGREELLARLRPAFKEAASAHADVLELAPEQLEQMVQRAADRADGLQWRRALASVASEQLGIGMGEALSHPAVARAQAIVGAPTYEESLEKLKAAAAKRPQPEPEPALEPDAPVEEEPEPHEQEPEAQDAEAHEPEAEEPEAGEVSEDGNLRIAAIHVGGIANLSPAESGIELRLSPDGLDIARQENEVLGRLAWADIAELEVPAPRGLRRKRRAETQLVVRTGHGDASFEIPGLSAEELRGHLEPMLKRYKDR